MHVLQQHAGGASYHPNPAVFGRTNDKPFYRLVDSHRHSPFAVAVRQ